MSIIYISQKIRSKTLETITEVIIDGEKLEILTDNQLGLQEIKGINDGEVINTITDGVQLSDYENKIFDVVIQSEIPENLVQLANSLKFLGNSLGLFSIWEIVEPTFAVWPNFH